MSYDWDPYRRHVKKEILTVQHTAMRFLGRELDDDELAYMMDPSTILGPFGKIMEIGRKSGLEMDDCPG